VRRVAVVLVAVLVATLQLLSAQAEGRAAFDAFLRWKAVPANTKLGFGDALAAYRAKLKADGLSDALVDRTLSLIAAYDEGKEYDKVYAGPPEFNVRPNQLLVDAVQGLTPGEALDVGIGQGRNAVFLAGRGWSVTGFDVSEVGLQKARERAAAEGLKLTAVHASDEEFDFGRARWDLIAIIYAIEKRTIHKVRDALKPGGIVVVEAGHRDTSGAPFEYASNELLEVFRGFRILRYEDTTGRYDWGPETIRLVRLVAQKPPA
jgi:SAM-dependent methyltransferase